MQLVTSKNLKFSKIFGVDNFKDYKSFDEPTIFRGVYSTSDIRRLIRHRGLKIIMFGGIDTADSRVENLNKIKNDKRILKNAVFIARGPWMPKSLDRAGIKYEIINIMVHDWEVFKPKPLGDCLYWYGGKTTKYGKKFYEAVRRKIPDLNIIIPSHRLEVPHERMPEIYERCFAGVRIVDHDAFGQSVYEMGLMGRKTIYNGGGPSSVPHKYDVDDIIRIIKELRRGYNHRLIARRMHYFYISNRIKWTELILKKVGVDAIDYLDIFRENPSRCASFFRIQRKADIDKIGGLGTNQYERPWFRKQMDKLGKKILVAEKASGYVASEWKNDGNKGYQDFSEYLTKKK